jgi:hypothetical protein
MVEPRKTIIRNKTSGSQTASGRMWWFVTLRAIELNEFSQKAVEFTARPVCDETAGRDQVIVVLKYGGTREIACALSLEPSLDQDRWPRKAKIARLATIKIIGRPRNTADHDAQKVRGPDNGKFRGSQKSARCAIAKPSKSRFDQLTCSQRSDPPPSKRRAIIRGNTTTYGDCAWEMRFKRRMKL